MALIDLVQPHGYCLAAFDPALVLANALGDLITATCYIVVAPFLAWRMTAHLARELHPLLFAAALFVFACGTNHLLNALLLTRASYDAYTFEAAESLVMATVSLGSMLLTDWYIRRRSLRFEVDRSGAKGPGAPGE